MSSNSDKLSNAMEQTLETSNLSFVGNLAEIGVDTVIKDDLLRDIPIFGTLVGVGKCIRNVVDYLFAQKLIRFLTTIKDCDPKDRYEAIAQWEKDAKYRIKVGETIIGMIARCDDSIKAEWLSKLFYHLVLKKKYSHLFMRAEKALSSLSVMDIQVFLGLPKDAYSVQPEENCEPYLGSGLYGLSHVNAPVNGSVDLDKRHCEITEVGIYIYKILNDIEK